MAKCKLCGEKSEERFGFQLNKPTRYPYINICNACARTIVQQAALMIKVDKKKEVKSDE